MAQRIQSPSSINTYKQCPRKYYYQYIEKLPTKPSIHLIRGVVAHEVLEKFFEKDIADINENNYESKIKNFLQEFLVDTWMQNKTKFDELKLTSEQLNFYFDETMMMILNFADHLIKKIKPYLATGLSFRQALQKVTPIAEEKFQSEKYKVRGFIDAIEEREDGTYIMDYKTSKTSKMSNAYKLQLSIYALMYFERFNKLPEKVGIFFLKDTEYYLDVNEKMIKNAQFEIEQIHEATITDNKVDYPMKPTPLCKWSTGQCDFFEKCFPNGRMRY